MCAICSGYRGKKKAKILLAAGLIINITHCVSFLLHNKMKRRALSTLGEAKQDVIGLCPQVYKGTILSQTNTDPQPG